MTCRPACSRVWLPGRASTWKGPNPAAAEMLAASSADQAASTRRFRTATKPTGKLGSPPGRPPEVTAPAGTAGTYHQPLLVKASIHHGRWTLTTQYSKVIETLDVVAGACGVNRPRFWTTATR